MRPSPRAGLLALAPIILAMIAGCHPGSVDDVAELDAVITLHDQDAAFGSFVTYAMEDSIYNLEQLLDDTVEDELARAHDDTMIALVHANLLDLGYQRVDLAEDPDVRLGMGAFTQEGTYAYWYYPWWPGYEPDDRYPVWDTVDFTKGTLVVIMADWANRNPEAGEFHPVWVGAIDGISESDDAAMAGRIHAAMTRMFDQSPYLQVDAAGEVTP
jgi:hypothetical protein